MGTPQAAVRNRIAVDPTVTSITDFDANSEQYEFLSETLRMTESQGNPNGIRGTRSRDGARTRKTLQEVGGQLVIAMTPLELDKWLPRILGAAESTDSFALAETIPEWGCLIDRGAKRFVYTGCKVARAVFAGTPGGIITCTMDVIGKAGSSVGTSWPATIPSIAGDQPYVFSDLTFSLDADASAAEMLGFRLTVDNFMQRRYANSLTATQVYAGDRLITWEVDTPFTTDEVDLYVQAVAGDAGDMTWTNGNVSTLWEFPLLQVPNEDPVTNQRGGENTGTLRMVAMMSGTDREVVVTHDSNSAS